MVCLRHSTGIEWQHTLHLFKNPVRNNQYVNQLTQMLFTCLDNSPVQDLELPTQFGHTF